jgi:NAD-dependent dihydropyrimidine dehydrogenase PreA subunit
MIEVVSSSRCIDCDICVKVCPTNVFETVPGDHPAIARQDDCQTCFLCEAYCPVDAIYVSPYTYPLADGSNLRSEAYLEDRGLLGKYRDDIGWTKGKQPSASVATPYLRQVMAPLSTAAVAAKTAEIKVKDLSEIEGGDDDES